MAGTVTVTEKVLGTVDEVKFVYASATTGAATGSSTQLYSGQVKQVLIYAGSTAPTDLYDVEVLDDNGIDVLFGRGANCPAADTVVVEDVGHVVNSKLNLSVSNAGDTKYGSVVVYVRE